MQYQERNNPQHSQDQNIPDSVYVDRSQKEITCPKCGKVQKSDRLLCYSCHVRFADKEEADGDHAVYAIDTNEFINHPAHQASTTPQLKRRSFITERISSPKTDSSSEASLNMNTPISIESPDANSGVLKKRTAFTAASNLKAPTVYNPTHQSLRSPSVKTVTFNDEVKTIPERSMMNLSLITAILGFFAGIALLSFDKSSTQLSHGILRSYSEGALSAHCLVYGTLVGLVYGMVIFPIYRNMENPLPIYATFLFLPLILFYLTSPLAALTAILIELGKLALGALGVFIGGAVLWGWVTGG